jgi:hypothetical protein
MAALTLIELKDAIQDMGFDANTKAVVLVGKTADGKFQFIQVDADGKLVVAS